MNPFISQHVPMSWGYLLEEFGVTVDYWPGGDEAQAVAVNLIWIEGVEDEDSSPGRYSHVKVQNSDLPASPRRGDAINNNGVVYDAVRVNAYAYGFSSIVIQERP